MAEEKKNDAELTDEELEKAQGGYDFYADHRGRCYAFTGSNDDLKFLCPKCGGPLHKGIGWFYYCDPCDDKWFFQDQLRPNLESGAWTRISKADYDRGKLWD